MLDSIGTLLLALALLLSVADRRDGKSLLSRLFGFHLRGVRIEAGM
jgi:hypothetical protein